MIWNVLTWLVLGFAILAYYSALPVAALLLGILTALMLWTDFKATAAEAKQARPNGLLAQATHPGSGVSKMIMFVVGALIFIGAKIIQHYFH